MSATPAHSETQAEPDERHLPVLAPPEARVLEPLTPPPSAQVVVAATGGFLAAFGAMLVMRLLRGSRRGPALGRRLGARRRRELEVTGTRSFLVDVHLLRR